MLQQQSAKIQHKQMWETAEQTVIWPTLQYAPHYRSNELTVAAAFSLPPRGHNHLLRIVCKNEVIERPSLAKPCGDEAMNHT